VVLVMDKDREYLIVPFREGKRAMFDGSISAEELTRQSGISVVLNESDGWKQLGSRLKRVKHAATIAAPPSYLDAYGMFVNPARARLIKNMKKHNADIE